MLPVLIATTYQLLPFLLNHVTPVIFVQHSSNLEVGQRMLQANSQSELETVLSNPPSHGLVLTAYALPKPLYSATLESGGHAIFASLSHGLAVSHAYNGIHFLGTYIFEHDFLGCDSRPSFTVSVQLNSSL